MQFIYTVQPTRLEMLTVGPTEDETSAVQAHVEYLEHLAQQGKVLLAGRTQTADVDTFGLVILDVETEPEAQALMDNDPAVASGVMVARLYPYAIAVLSDVLRTLR